MAKIILQSMFRLYLKRPNILQSVPTALSIIAKQPSYKFHLKTLDKEEINKEPQRKLEKDMDINNPFLDKVEYQPVSDPDIFGPQTTQEDEDPGDIEEEEYIQNPPSSSQKLRLKDYAQLIKENLNRKRYKEAIDILEIRMKQDRVKPGKYIFNLLISGCAKAGFSRKSFQLFNKMKQHGIKPASSTYTSLFNACSNAPWLEDGLNKANRLREIMLEKGYEPNTKNYNAMIKAYGRCGDVKTAYILADEMMEKNLAVDTDTFNFLLQACASDKEFGFRHALLTWHKMKSKRIAPDIFSFNTMIRCIRDCSIGDVDTMHEVISTILKTNDRTKQYELGQKTTDKVIEQRNTDQDGDVAGLSDVKLVSSNSENDNLVDNLPPTVDETPNLFSSTPHVGSLIEIKEIKKPEDRLLLLGGFSGYLNEMKVNQITPGIETFTFLLEIIPSTNSAEKNVISMIRKIGLKVDIDFFNVLMKKRCMRLDYDGAKEVLSMIKTARLQPDIVTYGVLALSCKTQDDAKDLLNQMNEKGIRMNIQILGAMLKQGCFQKNFAYVYEIMQISLDEKIRPNDQFLKHLDHFSKRCARLQDIRHPITKDKNFKRNYNNFKEKLHIWYEENGISGLKLEDAIKKIKESPYKQLKENQKEGVEDIKNEELMKKQKIRKYIKRIKLKDLKDDHNLSKFDTNV